MSTFVTAVPGVTALGIKDESVRAIPAVASGLPTHIPIVRTFTQKGPTTPQLVVGASRSNMYGADSFDETSEYFTHQTRISNITNANGNAHIIERMLPSDIGPKSTVQLWMDVLESTVVQYQRNSDGSFVTNPTTGEYVVDTTMTAQVGYSIRFVATANTDLADEANFGKLTQKTGTRTAGGKTSKLYPICEMPASSYGKWGNLIASRIWAATTDDVSAKFKKNKVFPFFFAVATKATAISTTKVKSTLLGDPYVTFVTKGGWSDPDTGVIMDMTKISGNYRNLTDLSMDLTPGDFGDFYIYQSNIDKLVTDFYAAEAAALNVKFPTGFDSVMTDFSSFTATDEKYLTNIFTAKTLNGVPYFAITVDTSTAGSVRLASNADIMASGGSDGTMSLAELDLAVISAMDVYLDNNSEYSDDALHPETFVYDSGFGIQAKYALMNFIGNRKDTNVWVAPYVYSKSGKALSNSEMVSLCIALKARLEFTPESEYFGTPVTRGGIAADTGQLANSNDDTLYPLTLEICNFNSKMAGAGNGQWKPEYVYDLWPSNKVTLFKNVSTRFKPQTVKNSLWDSGVTYAQAKSLTENFFPAIRSVYSDDTSVLTSHITTQGAAALQTIGNTLWREFTGGMGMSDALFIQEVNKRAEALLNGKFAGLFKIIPDCQITAFDSTVGYSWHMNFKFGADPMRTAMVLSVTAMRKADVN